MFFVSYDGDSYGNAFSLSDFGCADQNALKIQTNTGINQIELANSTNSPTYITQDSYGLTFKADDNAWGGTASNITFRVKTSEAMRIDSSGNVGIGTTSPDYKLQVDGTIAPESDNSSDLGTSSLRWANLYVADIQLSNKGNPNEVDGTEGNWSMQEGENDMFLINRKTGKRFKMKLEEVI